MPRGVYNRTIQNRINISLSRKGRHFPKLSHALKGIRPWNKDLTKKIDNRIAIYSKKISIKKRGILSPNTTGNKHWNWKGGSSKEKHPIGWRSLNIKQHVRMRDNYKCKICGITEEDHLIFYYSKLSVHHIDYNKSNMLINNLILLCASCHAKTNLKRDYWHSYFLYKLGGNDICLKTK